MERITLFIILSCAVFARNIDVSTQFHENFETSEYETTYDEAWSSCEGCRSDYHSSGSWDGTGFHRIYPPTDIGRPIPANGGRNAISHGLDPHTDIIYYGAVIRLGPTYEETALNTGYRTQNKFIIIDVEGVDNNRGMTILEANSQPMWMWYPGTTYSPNAAEWDYEQVCHNGIGYRPLQAHTASASNEPGTAGGAAYWQQATMDCEVDYFSFGWCEDNSCDYDYDAFRTSDYEDQWLYLEIMADRANGRASTSIYSRDGTLSGLLGSKAANFQTPFLSVGIGYFFNGIHEYDENNYIDIADIFMSDEPIGPPAGFVQTTGSCDGSEILCDDFEYGREINGYDNMMADPGIRAVWNGDGQTGDGEFAIVAEPHTGQYSCYHRSGTGASTFLEANYDYGSDFYIDYWLYPKSDSTMSYSNKLIYAYASDVMDSVWCLKIARDRLYNGDCDYSWEPQSEGWSVQYLGPGCATGQVGLNNLNDAVLLEDQWNRLVFHINMISEQETHVEMWIDNGNGLVKTGEKTVTDPECTANRNGVVETGRLKFGLMSDAMMNYYFDDLKVSGYAPPDLTIGCEPAHTADNSPCDNTVSLAELMAHINAWRSGQYSIQSVMEAIQIWKG